MDKKAREGLKFIEAEIHYAVDTEDEKLIERLRKELARLQRLIELRLGE
jgi:hypothetical protein